MRAEAVLAEVYETFGSEGLERVESCVLVLMGKRRPEFLHPQQEATRILFPGIGARPWYDPERFSWVPDVERSWKELREEFQALRAGGERLVPYVDPFTGDPGWPGWTTWHLYRSGVEEDRSTALCPETMRCLRQSNHGPREGMYSVLEPGAHLRPHTGGVNAVLTVHLPLVVPEGCGIRVGGRARDVREGQIMIFDDSFIHEAWNRGRSPRAVLVWDIWHPELTNLEIRALTHLLPRMVDYLTGR